MIRITKTRVRVAYWTSFVLFMVLVVFPLFFFFYLFDEQKVKQAIIDGFDSNNYQVQIHGHIVPKLWHGMSLDINDLAITNKNESELIAIRHMSCKLSWLDLVSGRYSVNRVAITGMKVNQANLLHYELSNLLGLLNKKPSIFNIEQLEVADMDFTNDESHYKLSHGSLFIDTTGLGAEFKFGIKINNTNYLLNGIGQLLPSAINFDSFNVHGYNAKININLNSRASYVFDNQQLILSGISGSVQANNYVGDINIKQADFGIESGRIDNLAVQVGATNNLVNNQLLVNADHVYIHNYKTFDIDVLHNQYKSNFTNINFNLDSKLTNVYYTESGELYSDNCNHQLDLIAPNLINNKFNMVLNGKCAYNTFDNSYNFDMAGQLNNEPLKLLLRFFKKGNIPNTEVNAKFALLDLSNMRSGDKKNGLFASLGQLPISWFFTGNLKTKLLIEKFVLGNTTMNDLQLELNLVDKRLNVPRFTAKLYQGTVDGNLKVVKLASGYNIYTKQKMSNLSLRNMLSDYFDINVISGIADVDIAAQALGVKNYEDILKKVTGDVVINAQKGAFQGVDFNLFANPQTSDIISTTRSTIFNRMQASFKFKDGVSNSGVLAFSSPYVIANGAGELNFVNNTLNYSLKIKSALPRNEQKISSVVIPVSIVGDILNPKVNIQNIRLIEAGSAKAKPKSKKKHRR